MAVTPSDHRRRELAAFLRSRRRLVVRSEFGLAELPRGASGLRREEVAFLSGVSVTWYTWLEQARDIHPSPQVLEAIARTLLLTDRERAYVLELAGHAVIDRASRSPVRTAPPHVTRLLDALGSYPGYAIAPDWSILAWNRAYEALYPPVALGALGRRNLLWLVFRDPYVRELLPDWAADSRHFVAQFRAEAGPRLGEPCIAELVADLLATSETFAAQWDSHDIEPFTSRHRHFRHPDVGDLLLEHHRLAPCGEPDLHLVVYTPADSSSAQRLGHLSGAEGAGNRRQLPG